MKLPLPTSVDAHHLVLQGGKLLKNVAQFISLSSTIVPVDLDQAAERLQGELTTSIHSSHTGIRSLVGLVTLY